MNIMIIRIINLLYIVSDFRILKRIYLFNVGD